MKGTINNKQTWGRNLWPKDNVIDHGAVHPEEHASSNLMASTERTEPKAKRANTGDCPLKYHIRIMTRRNRSRLPKKRSNTSKPTALIKLRYEHFGKEFRKTVATVV